MGTLTAHAAAERARAVSAPPAHDPVPRHPKRAPSAPALGSNPGETTLAVGASSEGATVEGAGVQGEADPLVENGLGSPLCKGALADELSAVGRRNCETSGFVAAPAPTGDYGLDVHIDNGVLGVSFTSATQDLFVEPLWIVLVWAVHALLVMLEWSYTINMPGDASGSAASALRQIQSSLMTPGLAIVLAVASMLAAYNGLLRRRVAETLAQALMTLAMMVGGMWVILNPTGTVGVLGGWANQASLGTLAITTRGAPTDANGALADSISSVFAAAIEAPWCYLEFGDVAWCRDPARLDRRLRAAGLRIAAGERAQAAASVGAQARALAHSATQLRDARNNAAVFLALVPNGPQRNSINMQGSLLRTLCQSSDASACRGPTAAQAQFRTGGGTWARVAGLLLIVAGLLGMLLLFGYIAMRLLGAALLGLFYLLLAPAIVLAPALGDGGRAVFRAWAARLFGAIMAKLAYSFLLGVMFAIANIIERLETLGWWTQWLLMSTFWWGAYTRRHHALGLVEGRLAHDATGARRSLVRRVREAIDIPRKTLDLARGTRTVLYRPAPDVERQRTPAPTSDIDTKGASDAQAERSLKHELIEARTRVRAGPWTQARLTRMRARLARVQSAREGAATAGNARKVIELGARERRIAREIADMQDALARAQRTVEDSTGADADQRYRERSAFLDAQTALPAAGRPNAHGERRHYAALAALAGHGKDEYERLDPPHRRAARAQIDRELALRRELRGAMGDAANPYAAAASTRAQPDTRMPAAQREREKTAPGARATGSRGRHTKSAVLDDAREVAAGRKRQLGIGRE